MIKKGFEFGGHLPNQSKPRFTTFVGKLRVLSALTGADRGDVQLLAPEN